jgi:hypothetical protein
MPPRSTTSPARVVAAHLRYPLRLADGRVLYELLTEGGRFHAGSPPEFCDAHGVPINPPAELAAGSVVRVSLVAGLLHTVQVLQARYPNPFADDAR